ncbi:putative RNA methylase family UPF0020-domain-containing protein [Absidia repens]|uniref:Putative RNA methylase family UPF0020-domain-containing protein n=1 Tax=Absidia repens TaxID=90262 RepID=A0A1X2I537_9FUNG|nr:putative RNA methylase family UPF0020-domain-containing protein [Absidia repens]
MSRPTIHILFHVPEGLEQIAIIDLKETILQFEHADPLATAFIGEARTGRVHMFSKLQQHDDTILWIQYLTTTTLLSVYHMTIITKTTTLPNAVYHSGQDSEVLGEHIFSVVKEAPWSDYISVLKTKDNDTSATSTTFRATFYKDQLQHGVKSQVISGWMGYAYSQIFPDWKVNLKTYDYDVVGVWGRTRDTALLGHFGLEDSTDDDDMVDNNSNTDGTEQQQQDQMNDQQIELSEPKTILLYIGLNIPIPDSKYRNRVHLGRTSLNPPIAYCLTRLANPLPGQIIMDMCCGTGTIPIEGAGKYPDTLWIGGEVKVKTLCLKAKGNMQHAGIHNIEFLLSDGRRLNFRRECVDTVISDWPWGMREGSYSTIQKLYPKFMREIGQVLCVGGKAYIVSQGNKLMRTVLDYGWVKNLFSLEEILPIAIGGVGVSVYVLIKK